MKGSPFSGNGDKVCNHMSNFIFECMGKDHSLIRSFKVKAKSYDDARSLLWMYRQRDYMQDVWQVRIVLADQ